MGYKMCWQLFSPWFTRPESSIVPPIWQTPQLFFMPAIDPFTFTNREVTDDEIDERLAYHNIPTDLPLVVQISGFDRWKDPAGVVEAFNIARREVPCTLVLSPNQSRNHSRSCVVYSGRLGTREAEIGPHVQVVAQGA
jgi:trehalose synthase